MGDQFLSSAGIGRICALPIRVPTPSPIVDKVDAVLLITVVSFLVTVELLCLQLYFEAFLLTIEFFTCSLSFLLTIEGFCLKWESASNKRLNELKAKKLNCKQKQLQL